MKISWAELRSHFSESAGPFNLSQAEKRFGLYVHFPFCARKCPYCHFYSLPYDKEGKKAWLEGFRKEVEAAAGLLGCGSSLLLETIYFGGGTPSLLSPDEIANLIAEIKSSFNQEIREITLECNPEAPADWLKGWKEAGVTRLSLGVQSFDDKVLKSLGRTHSLEMTWKLLEKARVVNFPSLNFDFMTGLPGETEATVETNLEAVKKFSPQHVSVYLLEELETVPFRAIWEENPVPEELVAERFEAYAGSLKKIGYEHYEISNYARPGFECLHNLKYWQYQPFLGVGPAAASHLGLLRWQNIADFKKWQAGLTEGFLWLEEFLVLSREEWLREKIAFGLRLKVGLDWEQLKVDHPGCDFSAYEKRMDGLVSSGDLRWSGSRVYIPEDRFLLSNSIISSLLF